MGRILLAIADFYQMDQVKEVLEEVLGEVVIDHVVDEKMAKEKIKNRAYDLIVIHQHLPRDRKTPIEEAENRGVGLSKWIDARPSRTPIIQLVFPSDAEARAAVAELPHCEAVIIEPSWEIAFGKRVRKMLAVNPVEEAKRLDVDLYIDLNKNEVVADLKGINLGVWIEKRVLQIKGSEMLKLSMNVAQEVDRSDGEKWQERLKKIGESLMRIFLNDAKFYGELVSLIDKVGGLQNTRIRFLVEEKLNAVALESIFGRHEIERDDYWMLHAPIYRTIQTRAACRHPLFHKEDTEMRGRPVNVLIIESLTDGTVTLDGSEIHLCELEMVTEECVFLFDYLCQLRSEGRAPLGEIELIRGTTQRESMQERVRKTLEGGQSWHVVHYAGHSYFDQRTQSGHVFFPGPGGTIKKVRLDLLSNWLRKANTRFTFLSSCHSSEVGFVFAMASQYIPAIVGFRWDIEDDMAFKYTQEFYKELLTAENPSLEYASLNARKAIYARHENNPIWAAPVLVIQHPSHY